MSAFVKMEERTMQGGTACSKDCCSVNAEEERNYENKEAKGERKKKIPIMVGVKWHQNEEKDAKVRNNENYDL